MIAKTLRLCFCCVFTACCGTALALPPLGLTLVDVSTGSNVPWSKLEIADSTAYISILTGVWTVNSLANTDFIPISYPTLGNTNGVTRVVAGPDSELYVGVNFGPIGARTGTGLFKLSSPNIPLRQWLGDLALSGVSAELRSFGNCYQCDDSVWAAEFFDDGSASLLPLPSGSEQSGIADVSRSGHGLGIAHIPATAGQGPVVWSPSGDFSFLDSCCTSSSIRDRADGNGVNVGWDLPAVKYGNGGEFYIQDENGLALGDWWVIVSHSNFTVLEDYFQPNSTKHAFYPGINPDFPNRAVPLLDIFPELASIDIRLIHDLASVDDYLYMTLSGADGTFLFGARDPSVVIPEPGTVILIAMATVVTLRRHELMA